MYTSEVKINGFIEEYGRSHVIIDTTVRAVLRKAVEYEQVYHKPFYEFDKAEIIAMFTSTRNKSVRSLLNGNLILKYASRWFLDQRNKPIDNPYDEITKDELKQCIDISTTDKMFVTRDQVNMIQGELLNDTDKAIIEVLFLGMTGRWNWEATYLTPDQVSYSDMCIYFRTGKIVPIDERAYHILQSAFKESELISYNNIASVSQVIGEGIYKIRCNTLNPNDNAKDDDDARRRARWMQRRLDLVAEYVGVPMTPKSLSACGFWHYSHVDMQEMGIENFKEYLSTEKGRALAARYGFKSKTYINTLLSKYEHLL
jgi:hypothetical protein